ncbi:MAG: DUF1877 family protein [Gordonia sp. (in: high G+C Gram-positive bacteria)]|uniref:DUF1877 family protein n=1 Tax=Gordonia sp. (in: high G+C Gram-positive bacteria) TaxID=84139 RepID=UPI0039E4FE6C
MGLIAEYLLIDDAQLTELVESDAPDELAIEWAEDDDARREDLDKLWDALHVVLTGQTSSDPVEGHPLSEAIIGVETLGDEESFVAIVRATDVPRLTEALRAVDVEQIVRALDVPESVREATYPSGIRCDGIESALAGTFALLLAFYERALAAGDHVVVSIL